MSRAALSRGTWVKAGIVLLGALAGLMTGCSGRGKGYPEQPVVLLVPWAAGGGSDRVARQIGLGLERELGVPVSVVNATGASGVIGHTRGALARPDGYTITLATAELNLLHWRGLTSITHESFQPGALINRDPAALLVRRDAPWASLAELNAHVLANPRSLQASGTALGGIWHVAMARWLQAIGAEVDSVRWISIEGTTPSLQELMAGGLSLVVCSLPEARALLEAGEVRALGVMSAERLDIFPNVPTFREQGVDIELGTWRGILLPKDVPPERSQVLLTALAKAAQSEDYRGFLRQGGFNWAYVEGADFGRELARLDHEFGVVLTNEAFSRMGEDVIGAMAFPGVIGALGAVVLVILLATGQLKTTDGAEGYSRAGLLKVVEFAGAVLVYLLMSETVGFILTMGTLVLLLMWRMRVKLRWALPVTLLVVVLVYQVFAVLLRVPLPRGLLGW